MMTNPILIRRRMAVRDQDIKLSLVQTKKMKYILEKIKFILGTANTFFDNVVGDIVHIADLIVRVGIKFCLFLLLYQIVAGDFLNRVLELLS